MMILLEPHLRPPEPTREQETISEKLAALDEIEKEIRHHEYRLDDLRYQREELQIELRGKGYCV